MSTWRRVARALHELGGSGTSRELGNALGGLYAVDAFTRNKALDQTSRVGVIRNDGGKWHLTPIGVAWCEGRATQVRLYPGGNRWVSTWLESLPRGIRITACDGAGRTQS